MLTAITVRDAILNDVPVLKGFEQDLINAERPFDSTLKDGEINYYDLEKMIEDPAVKLIVAEEQGKIIASGYGLCREEKPFVKNKYYTYVGFMYVLPPYRGKGINKLIMAELVSWSNVQGCHEIRLEVYAENRSAIKAYEKAGFVKHKLEMRFK